MVTVDYRVNDSGGQLVFAPGVTVQTFTVAITDDTKDEANELIPLALVDPVNATLGTLATATLTIARRPAPHRAIRQWLHGDRGCGDCPRDRDPERRFWLHRDR